MNDCECVCDDDVLVIWVLLLCEGVVVCVRLWVRDDVGGMMMKCEMMMMMMLRIVLMYKNENLYNVYVCEVVVVMRLVVWVMEVGMFAAANGGDGTTRACAGTRVEIMLLVCVVSVEELLEMVEGMRVCVEMCVVVFYYDCVVRNVRRMLSDEVSRRFRGVVARWSARGFDDL